MEYFDEQSTPVECKTTVLQVSDELQCNDKEEANAIQNYNRLLDMVDKSDLPRMKKEVIQSAVYEIISDELNHQQKLQDLYSLVTGIKANKE